ncbi:MAG: sugar ABC transporter permease [Clostridia bacterium]|nr:sugar ABC transporter permease [Clostridia bacterium]
MTEQVKMPKDAAEKPAPRVKKRKIASLDRRKARAGWLFVLPFVIGFIVLYVPIVFDSIKSSFYFYDVANNTREFLGWYNYSTALFESDDFVQVLLTGLGEMAFNIPVSLIFSLFVAVILNQKMIGRAAFRAIFFLPVVVSTGMMESLMNSSYNTAGEHLDTGAAESATEAVASTMAVEQLLTSVFEGLGFGVGLVEYIAAAVESISSIINRSGVQILIFLASLQSISPAIYESCQIDGATSWETFWKITFPMVSPMILVNGIYTIIDNFTTDSNSVMKVIAKAYGESYHGTSGRNVSSAMGWMYFAVVVLVVGLLAAIMSAYVFYQRRD